MGAHDPVRGSLAWMVGDTSHPRARGHRGRTVSLCTDYLLLSELAGTPGQLPKVGFYLAFGYLSDK